MEPPDIEEFFHLAANWLIVELAVPTEVIQNISKGSDWEVIIKLHALLESGLNEMLIYKLGKDLTETVLRLETSNAKTGKVAFAKGFGMITKFQFSFIRRLSELRNILVHDAKELTFSFSNWWNSLKKETKDAWKRDMHYYNPEKKEFSPLVSMESDLMNTLTFSIMVILTLAYLVRAPGLHPCYFTEDDAEE